VSVSISGLWKLTGVVQLPGYLGADFRVADRPATDASDAGAPDPPVLVGSAKVSVYATSSFRQKSTPGSGQKGEFSARGDGQICVADSSL
jgi:hypothetical protein